MYGVRNVEGVCLHVHCSSSITATSARPTLVKPDVHITCVILNPLEMSGPKRTPLTHPQTTTSGSTEHLVTLSPPPPAMHASHASSSSSAPRPHQTSTPPSIDACPLQHPILEKPVGNCLPTSGQNEKEQTNIHRAGTSTHQSVWPPWRRDDRWAGWKNDWVRKEGLVIPLIVQALSAGVLDATTYADFMTFASNRVSSTSFSYCLC
jgi:hypothetical protein